MSHRPFVLLDRDGTLNVDRNYLADAAQLELLPGAAVAMRRLANLGCGLIVVTNQSGVARGLYDEAAVRDLHAWMADEARLAGGTIDDIRYCPFHPEAVLPEYRRDSDWRKPGPGMILDLIRAWDLDSGTCILVGDQPSDLVAAAAAGVAGHEFHGGDLHALVDGLLRRRHALS